MSLWRRLRERFGGAERASEPSVEPRAAPVAPKPAPVVERSLLEALAAGDAVGEPALLAELARARGGSGEKAALSAVEAAARRGLAPEALRTRAAEIAISRGESPRALRLLHGVTTPSALLLEADTCAETGAVARALTLVERVLARDIDTPGARERHERWRRALGGRTPALVSALAEPTLLRADAPETSLRIVGEAGRGGAGTVFEAIDDELERRVALKIYHRPEREGDKLAREARTAVALAGAGVVRIYDVDLDKGLLVMEWLGAGSLKQVIQRRDSEMLLPIERWLVPLTRALARVHQAGLMHADLKPANVMFLAPGQPILSDFGLSHPSGSVVDGGSVGYMSPSRVQGEASGYREDLYGIGRLVEDVVSVVEAPARWRELAVRLISGDHEFADAAALAAQLEGSA